MNHSCFVLHLPFIAQLSQLQPQDDLPSFFRLIRLLIARRTTATSPKPTRIDPVFSDIHRITCIIQISSSVARGYVTRISAIRITDAADKSAIFAVFLTENIPATRTQSLFCYRFRRIGRLEDEAVIYLFGDKAVRESSVGADIRDSVVP